MGPSGLPAGDVILGSSSAMYAPVLQQPKATQATADNCSAWCDWNWTARAHAGIRTHGECTTRCLYQNGATDAQVTEFGYPNIGKAPMPIQPAYTPSKGTVQCAHGASAHDIAAAMCATTKAGGVPTSVQGTCDYSNFKDPGTVSYVCGPQPTPTPGPPKKDACTAITTLDACNGAKDGKFACAWDQFATPSCTSTNPQAAPAK
jgi:hypothetical protein